MSQINNLKMGAVIGANFKSLGEALGLATTKYWWLSLIGAVSGLCLHQFEQTFDSLFLTMFWVCLAALTLCLIAVQCRHSEEFITKKTQRFPAPGKFAKFALFSILLAIVVVGSGALGVFGAMIGMFAGSSDGVSIWVLLMLAAYLLALYLFSRLFLIMPALAVGNEQTRFKRSWQLTSGYSWKLVGIFFVAFVAIGLVTVVPEKLGEYLLSTDLVGGIVGGALSYWAATVSTIFYAETISRLFVFFHKPDLFHEYL